MKITGSIVVILALVACVGLWLPGQAMADFDFSTMEKFGDHAFHATNRLTRGAINVATGWAEMPKMSLRMDPQGGLERAGHRTYSGLMDMAMFAMEPHGESAIEPDYFSL
jgi:hypothetical protein